MTDERRFDEREVGLILKRVADLRERESEQNDAQGMTRGEIEEVVGELGISRDLVARAVSELSVQDVRNRPAWIVGGKTDVLFEQVVDGTIDEGTLTEMLEVLRRHLGEPGKLEHEGGARIWSTADTTGRRIHFTVVEHRGKSTLRLEENMQGAAGATVGVGAVAGGVSGFLTIVPLKAVLIKSMLLLAMGPLSLVGATLGWLGMRAWWKRVAAAREDLLRRMFGEILAIAGDRPRTLPALPAADDG